MVCWIEPEPGKTTTLLGSYDSMPGESSTKVVVTELAAIKTADVGAKPSEFNLLNFSKSHQAELAEQGTTFREGENLPFLYKAIDRRDPIAVLSPIHRDVLIKSDGAESGFQWELRKLSSEGHACHHDSGRIVSGSDITSELRRGAKLENNGHGIFELRSTGKTKE